MMKMINKILQIATVIAIICTGGWLITTAFFWQCILFVWFVIMVIWIFTPENDK